MTIKKVQLSRRALAEHIEALAKAFNITIVWCDTIYDARNYSLFTDRGEKISEQITTPRVVDEDTYYCALHELGHSLHPNGQLRGHTYAERDRFDQDKLRLDEELAAWEWAKAHALVWTRRMEEVAQLGFNSHVAEIKQRSQLTSLLEELEAYVERMRQRKPQSSSPTRRAGESLLDFLRRTGR